MRAVTWTPLAVTAWRFSQRLAPLSTSDALPLPPRSPWNVILPPASVSWPDDRKTPIIRKLSASHRPSGRIVSLSQSESVRSVGPSQAPSQTPATLLKSVIGTVTAGARLVSLAQATSHPASRTSDQPRTARADRIARFPLVGISVSAGPRSSHRPTAAGNDADHARARDERPPWSRFEQQPDDRLRELSRWRVEWGAAAARTGADRRGRRHASPARAA